MSETIPLIVFEVGIVYRFRANDADHAVEQFLDALLSGYAEGTPERAAIAEVATAHLNHFEGGR